MSDCLSQGLSTLNKYEPLRFALNFYMVPLTLYTTLSCHTAFLYDTIYLALSQKTGSEPDNVLFLNLEPSLSVSITR